MKTLTRDMVRKAMAATPWDFSNNVLYELCDRHPAHTDEGAVIAKILLIGRTYAAAIERRKIKTTDKQNDDFYLTTVAPALMNSAIDEWLQDAKAVAPGTKNGDEALLTAHKNVTDLFRDISGLEKRSLASKYLHFHVPQLFYIFDTRAVTAMRRFSSLRASRVDGVGDTEYRKFAERCAHLTAQIRDEFDLELSPRQIDNLLLASFADRPRAVG